MRVWARSVVGSQGPGFAKGVSLVCLVLGSYHSPIMKYQRFLLTVLVIGQKEHVRGMEVAMA